MNTGPSIPVVTILILAVLLIIGPACAVKTYTISASAGEGGVISPSGEVRVDHGGSQIFIIEAANGFTIGDVRVDGKSLGPISFYTFTNVREEHSIAANFLPLTGTLEIDSSPSGASVFLDGTYIGKTTPTGPARFDGITPGTHSLRLVLEGYEDYATDILISEGSTTTVPLVTLVPIPTTATTSPTPTRTPTPTPTPATTTTTSPTPTRTPTPTPSPTPTPTTTATTSPTPTQTPTPTPSPTPTTTATTSPTPTETTTPIESTIPAGLPATSPVPSNTTVPFETGPGNQGGLLPPSSPLRTLLVLVTGLLATVILSRDVLSSSREPLIPLKKRIIALFVLGIPCVAQAMALHATIRSGGAGGGLFFDLAVVVIPVSLYLVLSGTGLVIGALLSWPFRGMLKAHTVAGVVMVFLSLFSLARGDDPAPAITGLFLLSGLLAALGARWQEGLYPAGKGHGTRGEAENRVAGDSSDVTRALPSRGQGMLPPDLADKYSSIEFIGSGGLAHVYRAVNSATGQEVALKIPLRSDETTGKSFMKEIRGWEGLYHPNIVRVNEANILPIPYIEMEYIRRTLADVPKPLPVREAARIARDLCRGLSHAHERQVIHRDIKPHNIMITDDGIPKISDWGMSKIMGIPGMPTITGFSLAYAAPEQLAPGTFGETDRRTDIYQLGCVLYELLTGRVPFPGTDMAQVTAAILSATPPLPSELNPAARPLDTIVMRCLAKKPEDRYQDARDLERDLDQFLSGTSPYDDFDIFEDT